MAKYSANDFLVRVDSATPGTFAAVAGQTGFSIDRGEISFNTSDKASTVDTTARAMRTYGLSLEYKPDLPDTAGHGRLETIFASGAATVIQVVRVGTPTVVFSCPMRVATMPNSGPMNEVLSGTATFVPTGAPTVDTLA